MLVEHAQPVRDDTGEYDPRTRPLKGVREQASDADSEHNGSDPDVRSVGVLIGAAWLPVADRDVMKGTLGVVLLLATLRLMVGPSH
jgi:hypothetical protein